MSESYPFESGGKLRAESGSEVTIKYGDNEEFVFKIPLGEAWLISGFRLEGRKLTLVKTVTRVSETAGTFGVMLEDEHGHIFGLTSGSVLRETEEMTELERKMRAQANIKWQCGICGKDMMITESAKHDYDTIDGLIILCDDCLKTKGEKLGKVKKG